MLHKRFDFWLGAGTLLFLIASGAAFLSARSTDAAGKSSLAPLPVRAASVERRLRIDWDAHAPAVTASSSATLNVTDGAVRESYPVSASILQTGGLDYVRRTDDVLLRLTLTSSEGEQHVFVRSVAAAPDLDKASPEMKAPEQKRSRRARVQTRARRRR